MECLNKMFRLNFFKKYIIDFGMMINFKYDNLIEFFIFYVIYFMVLDYLLRKKIFFIIYKN